MDYPLDAPARGCITQNPRRRQGPVDNRFGSVKSPPSLTAEKWSWVTSLLRDEIDALETVHNTYRLGRMYDEKRVQMEWEPLSGKKSISEFAVKTSQSRLSSNTRRRVQPSRMQDSERRLHLAAKVPEIKPITDSFRMSSGSKRSCRSRGAMDMRYY
jgi:hypothetical protein